MNSRGSDEHTSEAVDKAYFCSLGASPQSTCEHRLDNCEQVHHTTMKADLDGMIARYMLWKLGSFFLGCSLLTNRSLAQQGEGKF